ncbi:hypothetical protein C3L33_21099, partial [Rhododendron williamsianum]
MGFVGFLKFAFKCFDLLAWPLFGLGCPLYASIQAIENNSNSKMRNLVAYWILFSLVSIFELAFVKLTDWLPFWPYLKLMAMCLLVLPDFNGASYVYECLLRPCLSVDPLTAMKYLIKPKEDKSLNAENFLAVAERYVQENGSEALEKLLDRKSKHTKPDIGVEEIKSMTNTEERDTAAATQVDARAVALPEKSPVAATKLSKVKEPHVAKENANAGELKDESPAVATEQVKCVEPNLAHNEKKTVAAGEIKKKTVATAGGESKAVEITDPEKVKRVWTCALCQVTTIGEKMLEYHLQGRRHKAQELKASKQVNESEGSSSLFQSKHTKPDIGVEEIKEMTITEEKETPAAIQSKCEDPNVGKVDARVVGLPEESPVAATKLSKVKEPHVAKENANVGEWKDENPAVATGEVKCVEPNLAQNEKNTVAAEEIKEKTLAAAGGENKAVKITDSEKVQREWTCALCQVTATSEKILDSHLQGRKHKAQELKASKQVNKNTDGEINHLQGRRPLFGLGCPLYASIWAVENNSYSEMRNVVAYWILFSLVSLFELAFVKLIDWLPFWPYIKLLAMCLLVLPDFNGASYVYECLLRPCLSSKHTKPDIGVEVMKAMTYTEEKETAVAIQSKYEEPNVGKVDARAVELPEKSPVAATKLSKVSEPHVDKENANAGELKDESPAVATEQVNCVEPNLAQNEKKSVATMGQLKGKNLAVATEQAARLPTMRSNLNPPRWQVKRVVPNLAQNEKKTVGAGEIKGETVAAAGGEKKAVQITDSEKVQREWTCALCQVTTTCEEDLNSHLQGREHMDKCEELKASKQVYKNPGSSSSAASLEPKKILFVDRSNQYKIKNPEDKVQVNRTNEQYREKKVYNTGGGMDPFKFQCTICDVKLISDIDVASHLGGKRHLSNTQQLGFGSLGEGFY